MGEMIWKQKEMREHWALAACTQEVLVSCLYVYVCDNLYQQLEWGFDPGGSYVQMPTSGETEIHRSVTRQTVWDQLLEGSTLYVCISSGPPSCSVREGAEWACGFCQFLCDCCVCLLVICVAGHVYMYLCTYVSYTCTPHVEAFCWLDLAACSDSSLVSLGLLNPAGYILL